VGGSTTAGCSVDARMAARGAVLLTVSGMTTPPAPTAPTAPAVPPVRSPGQLPLPFGADRPAPSSTGQVPDERGAVADVLVLGGLSLEPGLAAALGGLSALPDALTRARAATALLAELETARLTVAALRRTAVAATGLSSRDLAVELDLSLGAACDLRASARGRRRRPGR